MEPKREEKIEFEHPIQASNSIKPEDLMNNINMPKAEGYFRRIGINTPKMEDSMKTESPIKGEEIADEYLKRAEDIIKLENFLKREHATKVEEKLKAESLTGVDDLREGGKVEERLKAESLTEHEDLKEGGKVKFEYIVEEEDFVKAENSIKNEVYRQKKSMPSKRSIHRRTPWEAQQSIETQQPTETQHLWEEPEASVIHQENMNSVPNVMLEEESVSNNQNMFVGVDHAQLMNYVRAREGIPNENVAGN